MGSHTSQLRSRQQVQDSSTAVVNKNGSNVEDLSDIKAIQKCETGGNDYLDSVHNNNNNNDIDDEVTMIKEALNAANTNQQAGDTQQHKVNDENDSAVNQQKVSTLQRHASHLQSLAQRIRRSSSVRRFIPAFANGKRKASTEANAPPTTDSGNVAQQPKVEESVQPVDSPQLAEASNVEVSSDIKETEPQATGDQVAPDQVQEQQSPQLVDVEPKKEQEPSQQTAEEPPSSSEAGQNEPVKQQEAETLPVSEPEVSAQAQPVAETPVENTNVQAQSECHVTEEAVEQPQPVESVEAPKACEDQPQQPAVSQTESQEANSISVENATSNVEEPQHEIVAPEVQNNSVPEVEQRQQDKVKLQEVESIALASDKEADQAQPSETILESSAANSIGEASQSQNVTDSVQVNDQQTTQANQNDLNPEQQAAASNEVQTESQPALDVQPEQQPSADVLQATSDANQGQSEEALAASFSQQEINEAPEQEAAVAKQEESPAQNEVVPETVTESQQVNSNGTGDQPEVTANDIVEQLKVGEPATENKSDQANEISGPTTGGDEQTKQEQ